MPKKKTNIVARMNRLYSMGDKLKLAEHLKDKGQRKPKNWTLIHSEICGEDELEKDLKSLFASIEKKHSFTKDYKFFVPVVSNPNKESSLDFGEFRVRYSYGIASGHLGEKLIEDNTREFCSTLVRAKKIYRREDISIMSFRGANPIAKRNYSIFNLKGHWNCRHAWIREVFRIERDPAETENNPIVEKTRLMKNKKVQAAIANFKKETKGEKLTAKEIVAVNEQLLAEQKFADEKVGDKILRIDGEVAEGTAVNWVDEEGNLTDVPNGEITLEDGTVLTVTDNKISAVVEAEGEEEEETELAKVKAELEALKKGKGEETELAKVKAELAALKEGEGGDETDADKKLDAKLSAHLEAMDEKINSLPAFGKQKVKSSFKADKPEEDKDAPKRRPSVDGDFAQPKAKKKD